MEQGENGDQAPDNIEHDWLIVFASDGVNDNSERADQIHYLVQAAAATHDIETDEEIGQYNQSNTDPTDRFNGNAWLFTAVI